MEGKGRAGEIYLFSHLSKTTHPCNYKQGGETASSGNHIPLNVLFCWNYLCPVSGKYTEYGDSREQPSTSVM